MNGNNTLLRYKQKLLITLLMLMSLTGCESLDGLGKGLSDIFKSIKIPMP
jgi:hypothetical protein